MLQNATGVAAEKRNPHGAFELSLAYRMRGTGLSGSSTATKTSIYTVLLNFREIIVFSTSDHFLKIKLLKAQIRVNKMDPERNIHFSRKRGGGLPKVKIVQQDQKIFLEKLKVIWKN